jgi:hypothetical protein
MARLDSYALDVTGDMDAAALDRIVPGITKLPASVEREQHRGDRRVGPARCEVHEALGRAKERVGQHERLSADLRLGQHPSRVRHQGATVLDPAGPAEREAPLPQAGDRLEQASLAFGEVASDAFCIVRRDVGFGVSARQRGARDSASQCFGRVPKQRVWQHGADARSRRIRLCHGESGSRQWSGAIPAYAPCSALQ